MDQETLSELVEARQAGRTGYARRVRETADVSLAEIAGAASTSISSVSLWERGLRKPHGPGAVRWIRLIRLLEQQLATGVGGATENAPQAAA